MLKACVRCAGENIVRKRELLNAFQAQKGRVGNRFFERTVKRNMPPNRNANKAAISAKEKFGKRHYLIASIREMCYEAFFLNSAENFRQAEISSCVSEGY